MSDGAKKVSVTVDGVVVEVDAGTPLIEATKQAGADVPHFCYHRKLTVAGNCRMCAVEIEGGRGLPMSCATPCTDGMVVKTDTEPVLNHRKAVMEFLLVNHPIDCPICDQAGECKLQNYYMEHDRQDSHLATPKAHYDKRVELGPHVVLDQERCVECTRCIRFCDEVPKTGELRMFNRGDHAAIGTFPGIPLDNNYSVNTADICPVGALTEKEFRFTVRAWFLKELPTICPGCSRGCNVNLHYGHHGIIDDYRGKAFRMRPRDNDEVNEAWMCDFGRSEFHRVNDDRVTKCTIEGENPRFERAVERSREALLLAKDVVIVTSLESTLEEMYALKLLAKDLGGAKIVALPDRPDGVSDDYLICADKHPNRKGAEWLKILREPSQVATMLKKSKAVLVHRANLLGEDADPGLKAAWDQLALRVVVSATEHETAKAATHLLPGCSFAEKDGHWVNVEGRVQRIRKTHQLPLREGAADDLRVVSLLSGSSVSASPKELFGDLCNSLGFSELSWESVGSLGVVPEKGREGARA